jgi:hypothetical protein
LQVKVFRVLESAGLMMGERARKELLAVICPGRSRFGADVARLHATTLFQPPPMGIA